MAGPENNETLNQCWFNVGQPSEMLAQYLTSILVFARREGGGGNRNAIDGSILV